MSFPNHGTLAQRRKLGRIYGLRSGASRRAAMQTRTPDAYTQLRRSQDDRRGEIVRHGAIYRAGGSCGWAIRRAAAGNVRSFELIVGNNPRPQMRGSVGRCMYWLGALSGE